MGTFTVHILPNKSVVAGALRVSVDQQVPSTCLVLPLSLVLLLTSLSDAYTHLSKRPGHGKIKKNDLIRNIYENFASYSLRSSG